MTESLDIDSDAKRGRLLLTGILIAFGLNALQDPLYWVVTDAAGRTTFSFQWSVRIYIGLAAVFIAGWFLWRRDQWARWLAVSYFLISGTLELGRYIAMSSLWLDMRPSAGDSENIETLFTFWFWWAIVTNAASIFGAALLAKSGSVDAYFRQALLPPTQDPSSASLVELIKIRNEERLPRARSPLARKGERWVLILLYFFAVAFLLERANTVLSVSLNTAVSVLPEPKGAPILMAVARFCLEAFFMFYLYRRASWARVGLALYCWVALGLAAYVAVFALVPQLESERDVAGTLTLAYGSIWTVVFENTLLLVAAGMLSFSPAIKAFFAEARFAFQAPGSS